MPLMLVRRWAVLMFVIRMACRYVHMERARRHRRRDHRGEAHVQHPAHDERLPRYRSKTQIGARPGRRRRRKPSTGRTATPLTARHES
jgi:hypothetical protein